MPKKIKNQKGFVAFYLTILILVVVSALAFSIYILTRGEQKISRNIVKSSQAYYTAEAGIEDAIYRIINNKQYSATYNIPIDENTTEVAISGTNTKTITSQANINNVSRKLQATLTIAMVNPQFYYGVQMGEGGVSMGENSMITGTGGSVGNFYSNGPVIGDSGATITGDVIVATGISLGEQSTVCNTDQIIGQTNPQIDFAQSFLTSDSKPLAKISLYIKKVGDPDDRTIRITNDDSGSPAKTSIRSATLNASLVETNYGWIDIVFSSPPNLIKNNTYWIVFDAVQNSNKYWIWCKYINGGYGNGVGKYSKDWDNDPWTQIIGDLAFKTYLGTGESVINNITVYRTARANIITNSKICGDAYYKSTSSIDVTSKNFLDTPKKPPCLKPLTLGTGYPDQPDPPVSPAPISQSNINQWKTEATNGGVINGNCGDNSQQGGSDPTCTINDKGILSLGPKKISGNLVLTKKQTLNITGILYFQGYIDIDSRSGATIKCDSSFGENSCLILTDSWGHLSNNMVFQGSGVPGSYVMLLTDLQGCNGGTQQPQCTHHNAAIDIHNNAIGSIFYAGDSMIHLHNGVNVTEVTAYKLELENNAIVVYEKGLINANFSSGPGGDWEVTSWKEIE